MGLLLLIISFLLFISFPRRRESITRYKPDTAVIEQTGDKGYSKGINRRKIILILDYIVYNRRYE